MEKRAKRCTSCGNVYTEPEKYFSTNVRCKDGLHSHCRKCRGKYSRKRKPKDLTKKNSKNWKCTNCGKTITFTVKTIMVTPCPYCKTGICEALKQYKPGTLLLTTGGIKKA